MPVLDMERSGIRSALRYRPSGANQTPPEPGVSRSRRVRSERRTTAVPAVPDDLTCEERQPSPAVRSSRTRVVARPVRQSHLHPLVFVGIGLLSMTVLLIGVSALWNWGTNEWNTWKYGNPRTFQIDAVVGQGDSVQHPSHFFAMNLHGTVTIMEFPAGDPSHARVLATTTITGPDASLAVVTLCFADVNHTGKPDLFMDLDGGESVLVNEQGTFRLPTSTEQQQILTQWHCR